MCMCVCVCERERKRERERERERECVTVCAFSGVLVCVYVLVCLCVSSLLFIPSVLRISDFSSSPHPFSVAPLFVVVPFSQLDFSCLLMTC